MSSRCSAWPATVAGLLLVTGPAWADSARLWSFKPEKGFVDEPMAFTADDSRFAYLHTDAAEFLKLIILRTEGFKQERVIDVEDPTRVPRQLAFSLDGSRLILTWSEGQSGSSGAAVYDVETGKVIKKLGPATAATVTDCGGEQCVALTVTRPGAEGAVTHSVTAYRTRDLKRIGAGSVTIQADQTVKSPTLRLLYFDPGNVSLMGMQKGKYDKQRDLRLPERAVRFGLLGRKELWGEEPGELLAWTRAINMRPNHPGQLRFVQVSDDLKELLLVDRENRLARLTVPVKWRLYDAKSLAQMERWDGKELFFSLTVDPVNPEAVKRKKADKERVDLYRVLPGPAAAPLGRVETGKRGFRWAVGSQHFSYQRRLKGFVRGGTEVELYKLGL